MLILFSAASILHAQDDPPAEVDSSYEATDTTYEEDSDVLSEQKTGDEGYFMQKWMKEAEMNPVSYRYLPDSVLNALKHDDAFWYADSIFRSKNADGQNISIRPPTSNDSNWKKTVIKPQKEPETSSSGSVLQMLLWIIIIGAFVAFIIIYLANSNVRLFSKKNKSFEEETEELDTDNIFAINYQKEIDKAAASGNHRLAIRLMFLRLLKNLSEKNIIRYQQDKTNFDYLAQLSSTRYYNDFFKLTRNYEYSWYGKFDVSPEAYAVIKKDFENFEMR